MLRIICYFQSVSMDNVYEELDRKMSDNLLKLNEMMDKVLGMRANCGKMMLELKLLYSPEYLQELNALTEEDEMKDIKRYIDLVKELQGPQKTDERTEK